MLAEHLSQVHDAASRRSEKIDAHVGWIHSEVLGGMPTRVLDLGCGPGFYSARLARLGHSCLGIDYSPASIVHARQVAEAEQLSCHFVEADIREAEHGVEFGLVMLIFGELNVFPPDHARSILQRAQAALDPGGRLLLEPHTDDAVRKIGGRAPTWYSSDSGLFSDRPHLLLQEHSWDEHARTATIRYFLVDADGGSVTRYAQTMQAYTNDEYRALLEECGFGGVEFVPSLTGEGTEDSGLQVIVAEKLEATAKR